GPDSPAVALRLIDPPWPAFDRYLRGAVLLALVALAVYAVVPGAAQELAPRDMAVQLRGIAASGAPGRGVPPIAAFEAPGLAHRHAMGLGSWALLVVAVGVMAAGQWERFRRLDWLGALVAASMAAPLGAAWWERDVAAASALRWAGAVVLL